MTSSDSRPSSRPSFWDDRYAREEGLFGRAPSAFVVQEAPRISRESDVVELGAGEGRTLLWLARERGTHCTAVDFSSEALSTARRWAQKQSRPLQTIEADVREWDPPRRWDVVLVTFLQLLPNERPALYRTIRSCLQSGGLVIGEWFRPDHLTRAYDRVGPSSEDRMVPVSELRDAFASDDLLQCAPADVKLEEGPFLRGRAAVVRLLARRNRQDPD